MSISLPPEPCSPVPRHSTVRVRDRQVVIECPSWCVTAHEAGSDPHLDDVVHEGAPTALSVPSSSSGQEQVLIVRIVQWPFADQESDRRVTLTLEVAEDSDVVELDATLASSVAEGMEKYAAHLRRLSNVVTS